ncbi:MAG: right-handed parallel beta-helix repeat-containing protein [Planctomycetota bacterium]|jgi:hypothetical protein
MKKFTFDERIRSLAFLIIFFIVKTSLVGADFYVSPSGSDANLCSLDKPFATIQKAKEAVRQLKQNEPNEKITVYVRGGVYKINEPITFEPQDSGTKDNPITYQAYSNEVPILYGGQKIVGWKPLKQEKFIDPKAKGKLWVATVPNGWDIRQIFVNGKVMQRSITPNTDEWGNWPKAEISENENDLILPMEIVKQWSNASDMQINYLPTPYSKWNHYVRAIEKINNNIVTLKEPVFRSLLLKPTKQIPVRIENALEGINTPGEWCIEAKNNRVYLWPPENVDLRTAEVITPKLEQAIIFDGNEAEEKFVKYINLKGLAIQQTAKSGISLSAVESCSIDSCRISQLSGTGISATGHVQKIHISNCKISLCGHSGIRFGGQFLSLKKINKNNIIENNHIYNCGILQWHSPGIHISASKNIIRKNYIHNMPYSGIQLGGARFKPLKELRKKNWQDKKHRWDNINESDMTIYGIKKYVNGQNLVENNVVHDVMQQLEDGGAIYSHASHHNIVRNNVVYRLKMKGSRGLYFDDDEMFSVMENNLVYECPILERRCKNSMGILLHDNAHNCVRRNIIAITERVAYFPKGYGGHRITDNVFVFIGEGIDPLNLFRNKGRYEDIKWDAGPNIMDNNVYWNIESKEAVEKYLEKWQQKGWDKNSIVANPGFKDIEKRDFSFETSSIAWQMGILPIDTSDVGIQSNFAAVK